MPEAFGHIGWRAGKGTRYVPPAVRARTAAAATALEDDALVARFVYLIIVLYAVTFAILSALQHLSFQTNAFDLGNMDQAVWNTYQGRPLEFTNWPGGTNRLAAHVEPILLLVAQAYRIHSSPLTLLALQSVVISLGAIPAFWLARDVLKNSLAAAVFAFSYLLSPALEIANLSDFHAVAFSSAFLLFAFTFAHRRQYLGFFVFAILAMSTKEQVPLSVMVLSGYIALVQRRPRVGIAGFVLAAVWLVVAFGVVIPHFNPAGASPYLSRYDQLGKSPGEIALTLLRDPQGVVALLSEEAKVHYVQNILSPTLYLALLSPLTLAMAAPDLGINLLSNFTEMYAGRAHYGSVIVPFVTVSAILGAGRVRWVLDRWRTRAGDIAAGIIAVAVLVSVLVNFHRQVFLPLTDHLPQVSARAGTVRAAIDLIPPEGAVSASSNLNPHVSQRRQLALFPDIDKAEYVLLDVTASPHPIDAASMWWRVQQMTGDGAWGVRFARDGVLLLQRGASPGTIGDEFTSFARPDNPAPRTKVAARFGETLSLVGYDLTPGNTLHGSDPYAALTLYWQLERPLSEDFIAEVSVVRADGSLLSRDRYQAALLWHPPSHWQPGEVVAAESLWLPLGAEPFADLRVRILSRQEPVVPVDALRPQADGLSGGVSVTPDGEALQLTRLRRG